MSLHEVRLVLIEPWQCNGPLVPKTLADAGHGSTPQGYPLRLPTSTPPITLTFKAIPCPSLPAATESEPVDLSRSGGRSTAFAGVAAGGSRQGRIVLDPGVRGSCPEGGSGPVPRARDALEAVGADTAQGEVAPVGIIRAAGAEQSGGGGGGGGLRPFRRVRRARDGSLVPRDVVACTERRKRSRTSAGPRRRAAAGLGSGRGHRTEAGGGFGAGTPKPPPPGGMADQNCMEKLSPPPTSRLSLPLAV